MKTSFITSIILTGLLVSANSFAGKYQTVEQRYGYALGKHIGEQVKQRYPDADKQAFIDALSDVLKGQKIKLTDKEINEAIASFRKKKMAQHMAMGKANLEKGKAFIARFKKEKGVKELSNGIYYRIVESGKGTSPGATSKVQVHYRGTHINGKEFDSSYKRGQPATFPLNGVIKGWTITLQKMRPGDKWQVAIPSELAYGAEGPRGSSIGSNETLIFEIELLKVL